MIGMVLDTPGQESMQSWPALETEDDMGSLLTLALVLLALWVVVNIVFGVVNFLVHVLLLVGAVLFLVWLFRKVTGRDSEPSEPTL